MIIRILLYIKHKLPFIWKFVDWLNASLFRILYNKKFKTIVQTAFERHYFSSFESHTLLHPDIPALRDLIQRQTPERLTYFQPHDFDEKSLSRLVENPSFLMMGVFDGARMVGYFFLRCFWNKKCFVGRLIDNDYEGKGIGSAMNLIMYEIAWNMGFRCLSTISRHNSAVMKSHSRNPNMIVLKELDNDYLLVEFVRNFQDITERTPVEEVISAHKYE